MTLFFGARKGMNLDFRLIFTRGSNHMLVMLSTSDQATSSINLAPMKINAGWKDGRCRFNPVSHNSSPKPRENMKADHTAIKPMPTDITTVTGGGKMPATAKTSPTIPPGNHVAHSRGTRRANDSFTETDPAPVSKVMDCFSLPIPARAIVQPQARL